MKINILIRIYGSGLFPILHLGTVNASWPAKGRSGPPTGAVASLAAQRIRVGVVSWSFHSVGAPEMHVRLHMHCLRRVVSQ